MQALAGRDTGDFDRAAPHAGIGEQHRSQGLRAQLGEPAAPPAQGPRRNQGAGEHPGPLVAQQMDLAGPSPGIRAQLESARLVAVGASPTLAQDPNTESARAGEAQAPGQRSGVEQPEGQAGGRVAREQPRGGVPARRRDG